MTTILITKTIVRNNRFRSNQNASNIRIKVEGFQIDISLRKFRYQRGNNLTPLTFLLLAGDDHSPVTRPGASHRHPAPIAARLAAPQPFPHRR